MSEPGVSGGLERASTLCDLGRYAEAEQQLNSVLAAEPENYDALCILALTRLGLSNWQGALNMAHAAMSVDPDNDWAYRLAALALIRLDRADEAVLAAREAVDRAPHLAFCYSVLAAALVEQRQDLDEARRAADHAVSLSPNSADAHLSVCAVAAAQSRWDDAERAVHQALAIDPNSSAAHNELGRIHLRRRKHFVDSGGLARAAGGFATALRTDPHSQVARTNLDIVLQVFLARAAYGVVIVAYVSNEILTHDTAAALRIIPIVLLLVPIWFAVRFVHGLTPPLRGFLRDVLRRPAITVAVACDALAALGIVVAVAAPPVTFVGLACAWVFGIGARLLLWRHRRSTVGQVMTRPRWKRRR